MNPGAAIEEMTEEEEERLYHEQNLDLLLFDLGGERYAAPLLQVKEIVEPKELKDVPKTADTFAGVFNLRGCVIGAFDLRQQFATSTTSYATKAYLVCETDLGQMALLVDKAVDVKTILRTSLRSENALSGIFNHSFVTGVVNIEETIVTIVDLEKVLLDQDTDAPAVPGSLP
ncbi:MAG: chemotaxis protein CheW [Zetaproteobacteria bacterium]|nr:chemotaxis protein CheW [Zetaproteobacteria bacterium]